MTKAKKLPAKWNLKSRLTSAIRKIWRTSPLKQLALKLACINTEAPVRERLYKCSCCNGEFLAQSVDIDHNKCGPKGELLNSFVNRLFLGLDSVYYREDGTPMTEYAGHEVQLEEVVRKHLSVLCLTCHKAKTKAEAIERKAKK
jgi:hypothetical protein